MGELLDILHREFVYLWYYFTVQLEQIFLWWVLGMVIGSAISVFAKDKLHHLFGALSRLRLGALGVIPASLLGIASPLCMYGTIPIAAAFARQGMRQDWLAAFMMSSILLNPQLILYSGALGSTALWVRLISCSLCGAAAGWLVGLAFRKEPFFDFTGFDGPVSRDTDPNPVLRFLKNLGETSRPRVPCSCWGWCCPLCSSGMCPRSSWAASSERTRASASCWPSLSACLSTPAAEGPSRFSRPGCWTA